MTKRFGCSLGYYNDYPYKSPHTPKKFVIPRERSDRGNLAEAETVASATEFYLFVYGGEAYAGKYLECILPPSDEGGVA